MSCVSMVTLESVSKIHIRSHPQTHPQVALLLILTLSPQTMKRYKTNVVVDQRPRGLNALLALGEKLHHLALVAFPKLPPTAPLPPPAQRSRGYSFHFSAPRPNSALATSTPPPTLTGYSVTFVSPYT